MNEVPERGTMDRRGAACCVLFPIVDPQEGRSKRRAVQRHCSAIVRAGYAYVTELMQACLDVGSIAGQLLLVFSDRRLFPASHDSEATWLRRSRAVFMRQV